MPHPVLVHSLTHESAALRGNPLGDPTEREVLVLEPAQLDDGAPCPAVLVLAGFTGSGFGFLNRHWREENLVQRWARLMAQGAPPLRLVLPDPLTRLGGGQYVDSPGTGRYAPWLVEELLPWFDALFPTGGRWGVLGRSSGGYGALVLPTLYPGVFTAAAAHSPDAAFEVSMTPDLPGAVETLRDAGGLGPWLMDFEARGGTKPSDHAVLNLLALSCAWSPDPGATPLPCALPVDLDTGALRPEVFERWLAWDPVRLLPAKPAGVRALRGLWLDVGRKDEFRLQVGARLLRRALEPVGVSLRYEEHPGGHFKLNERLDASLPWLARVLRA